MFREQILDLIDLYNVMEERAPLLGAWFSINEDDKKLVGLRVLLGLYQDSLFPPDIREVDVLFPAVSEIADA